MTALQDARHPRLFLSHGSFVSPNKHTSNISAMNRGKAFDATLLDVEQNPGERQ
jgi:hypothetical protein